jgi:SAM-dependent methyltransferase
MTEPVEITRDFGREAFGEDPDNYDAARPPYPDWIYETLMTRCGLGPGCAMFEAGAGTGIATRRLLAAGASPVVAIEPDPRLAAWLAERSPDPALRVVNTTFESAELEDGAFDLGVCATAFHWLDEDAALARIARALKGGGWWAMWWNVYYAEALPDPFHEATKVLLGPPVAISNGVDGRPPYAFDVDARQAAVDRAGAFEDFRRDQSVWWVDFDPDQVTRLYASYSDMTIRPPDERRRVLAELRRIAAEEFGGRVRRNITTVLYTARRRA